MNSHQRRKLRRANAVRLHAMADRITPEVAARWREFIAKREAREAAHQAEMRRRRAELGVEG